jgi:chromosomal replication initiator protein
MVLEGISFWPEVLSALSTKLNNPVFTQWTRLTSAQYNSQDNCVTITVPNSAIRDRLVDSLRDLKKIIDDIMFKETDIKISIDKTDKKQDPSFLALDKEALSSRAKTTKRNRSNFIPRFTFQDFVVGSNNQFAHAACLSVAARPSKSYNPLFIFGGSGLGKTHLLHAIGNYISEYFSNLNVLYTTGERFLNDYTKALINKSIQEFRKKVREEYDVILIDDIQFIAGKEKTQEELFNTISVALENNKQIVLASDKFPEEIEGLDSRIKTRMASGLICDIKAPELETRIAIINKKSLELNMQVSDKSALKIAELFPGSIRELEGVITSIGAYSSFSNTQISPDFIEEVFYKKKINVSQGKSVELDNIVKHVSNHYHLNPGDLFRDSRSKEFVLPRHIAIYISKKMSNKSLTEIASFFNKKNHSTVAHAYEKIDNMCKSDFNFKTEINHLIEKIRKQ